MEISSMFGGIFFAVISACCVYLPYYPMVVLFGLLAIGTWLDGAALGIIRIIRKKKS